MSLDENNIDNQTVINNTNDFYQKLKEKKSFNLLFDLKQSIINLETVINNQNINANTNIEIFCHELSIKFSEMVDNLTDEFIRLYKLNDFNNCLYSNYQVISEGFESLISKSIHDTFFKKYLNHKSNSFTNYSSNSLINTHSINNCKSKDDNNNNNNNNNMLNQPTKLHLLDMIFEKKLNKYTFLTPSNFNIEIDPIYIVSKFKIFQGISKLKSSKDKLKVISSFYKSASDYLCSNDFETLVRFTCLYLIQSKFSYIKSSLLFLNIFRIKNLITSEEDYYLSVIKRSIDTIEAEFSFETKEGKTGLIQLNIEEIEENLIEYRKKDMLNKRFINLNKDIFLNPVTTKECIKLINAKSNKNCNLISINNNGGIDNIKTINENIFENNEEYSTSDLSSVNIDYYLNKYYAKLNSKITFVQFCSLSLNEVDSLYLDFKEILNKIKH